MREEVVKNEGVEDGEIDRGNKRLVDRGYCSLEHRKKRRGRGVEDAEGVYVEKVAEYCERGKRSEGEGESEEEEEERREERKKR